jgi:F0F1-type ATP synthase membrane subunit c/vacuolar-type H+-ATPase subunit K
VTLIEREEGVPPATARQLQIIAGAMGTGLTLLAAAVVWFHAGSAGRIPDPKSVQVINTMITTVMVLALGLIAASEFAWRSVLRQSPGPLGGRVQTAFIVRLAMREGAGLLGLVVAFLAARNGVLRAYPAYWVGLAPYALFLGFLAAHWPTEERLGAEAREVLSENPSFLKK